MNKENTEKLIKIINLLDKLCEYNEGETDGCKKSVIRARQLCPSRLLRL